MSTFELSDDIVTELDDARITRFGNGISYKKGQIISSAPRLQTEEGARQPGNWLLNLGAYSYSVTGHHTLTRMTVGRFCSIAAGLIIADGQHPLNWASTSPFFYSPDHAYNKDVINLRHTNHSYGRSTIGHDVWIGRNTILKAGVNIGHGAIVALGSVVVRDVEPYTIVGGNPAKIIRPRFDANIAEELLSSEWWNFPPEALSIMPVHNVKEFIKECGIMNGEKYSYRKVCFEAP